jgi:hypothetical protein
VTLTVQPRKGLRARTKIANRATIVFDVNAPIRTRKWLNRLDAIRPASRVTRVSEKRGGRLRVRWQGRDRGSRVRRYAVFVSESGGPFRPWLAATRRRSSTYPGRRGRRYAFATAATDLAGNAERLGILGDAVSPGLRARRARGVLVLRTAVRAERAGTVTASVAGKRGRLATGSRLGRAVARRGAARLRTRVRRSGILRVRLRVPAARVRGRRVVVVLKGSDGSRLALPFRR